MSKRFIIIFVLVSLFLFWELHQIELPGLHDQEIVTVKNAHHILRMIKDYSLLSLFSESQLHTLTTCQYHGALETYLSLPFLHFFGMNAVSLRLVPIFFALVTIIATYLFAKLFFNDKVALLSIFLLVINFAFISATKIGIWNASVMSAFSMSSLLFFLKCYRSKKIIYFFLAMFILGLGLTARIWFAWLIVSLAISALVFLKDIKNNFVIKEPKGLIFLLGGILSFCLGSLTLIIYNIKLNFVTLTFLIRHFRSSDMFGIDNLDYFKNLSFALRRFHWFISGSDISINQLGIGTVDNLFIWVFWLSIPTLTLLLFLKKNLIFRRQIIFLLVIFFTMLLQSPITPSQLPHNHYFFFFPFLQLIIAICIYTLYFLFNNYKFISFTIFAFILSFGVNELFLIQKYFYHLERTGGVGFFSDAIYRLADYLKENNHYRVLVYGEGVKRVLEFLTEGKIAIDSPSYFETSTEFKDELYQLQENLKVSLREELKNENNLYIFRPPELCSKDDFFKFFLESAGKIGKCIHEEKKIFQRDGKPVYLIYTLKDR